MLAIHSAVLVTLLFTDVAFLSGKHIVNRAPWIELESTAKNERINVGFLHTRVLRQTALRSYIIYRGNEYAVSNSDIINAHYAESYYSYCIDSDIIHFEHLQLRASIRKQLGKIELAISDCSDALRQQPTSTVLLLLMIDLKIDSGDIKAASESIDLYIAVHGETDKVLSLRGRMKCQKNDYRGALQDITKAISLDPANDGYQFEKYQCYMSQKMYDEAHVCIVAACKIRPMDTDYLYALGYCLVAQYENEKALVALNDVLRLDPSHCDALLLKYKIERSAGRFSDAKKTLHQAIIACTDVRNTYFVAREYALDRNEEIRNHGKVQYCISKLGVLPNAKPYVDEITAYLLAEKGLYEDALALLKRVEKETEASPRQKIIAEAIKSYSRHELFRK